MRLLTVAPLADSWKLSIDNVQNDMVFTSGAAAEAAARRLALRLSQAGTPAEVKIYLRDQSLGARFISPPASRAPETCVAARALADLAEAA